MISMDWLKGKATGNHTFSHEIGGSSGVPSTIGGIIHFADGLPMIFHESNQLNMGSPYLRVTVKMGCTLRIAILTGELDDTPLDL